MADWWLGGLAGRFLFPAQGLGLSSGVENEGVAGPEIHFAAAGLALEDKVWAQALAGVVVGIAVVFNKLQLIEQAEILMLAGLGQQPEAGLAAGIAGPGFVAEQGEAHFAGREADKLQAVGALYQVGGGPGVGHVLGLFAAEAGQAAQIGPDDGRQQLPRLARAGGAGQLQLYPHQLVAGIQQAVNQLLVLVDAAHGALAIGGTGVQDAGAAPAGGFAIGPEDGLEQQAVELGLGRVVGPGRPVGHRFRAFQLNQVVAGGAFVQQVEAALQAVGGREEGGLEKAVGHAQALLLVAAAAVGHEAAPLGVAQGAVVPPQVVEQLGHAVAGLEFGQGAQRQRRQAKKALVQEMLQVEVRKLVDRHLGLRSAYPVWLGRGLQAPGALQNSRQPGAVRLYSCFFLFCFALLLPGREAYFLVQQHVHQVAQHQRARGFIGQKGVYQGPFGNGAVLLGALGHRGHADEVIGLQYHAAGLHAAIGQQHRANEVQRGVQHGGHRQQAGVGLGQHHVEGPGGAAIGGRFPAPRLARRWPGRWPAPARARRRAALRAACRRPGPLRKRLVPLLRFGWAAAAGRGLRSACR